MVGLDLIKRFTGRMDMETSKHAIRNLARFASLHSPPSAVVEFGTLRARQALREAEMQKRRLSTGAERFAFALVLAVAAIGDAAAQELPAAKPESVGLSSERLERITMKVQQTIDEKRIAGAVTLVARHGKVVYFKSQGSLDREANKPMRNDAIFRICSMTKPITSVAVMMLYEDGKFLLEDPVSKYLTEFKNPKVLVKSPEGRPPYTIPAAREITIKDLLTHPLALPMIGTKRWVSSTRPLT
jgi:CubicO group peptidase (beta-lactamase class C family)